MPVDEDFNSPCCRGLGERTPQRGVEVRTIPEGGREEETTTGRGLNRIPPEEALGEGDMEDMTSLRVCGEAQQSLPLMQQGLTTNTKSSRAGPLSKLGKHQERDDRRMEKDEDLL